MIQGGSDMHKIVHLSSLIEDLDLLWMLLVALSFGRKIQLPYKLIVDGLVVHSLRTSRRQLTVFYLAVYQSCSFKQIRIGN